MQYFKGDADELKWIGGGADAFDTVSLQKDTFYEECFECFILGDIIKESDLSPLAGAINTELFRENFVDIFEAFVLVGTFDAYITVFQAIFGGDSGIEFTVPAPGKLNIDIEGTGIEESPFLARYIQNNSYNFDFVIDDEDDNIVFQSVMGFQSQYELEQMLFEMVPAGIFTTISLTLGT